MSVIPHYYYDDYIIFLLYLIDIRLVIFSNVVMQAEYQVHCLTRSYSTHKINETSSWSLSSTIDSHRLTDNIKKITITARSSFKIASYTGNPQVALQITLHRVLRIVADAPQRPGCVT